MGIFIQVENYGVAHCKGRDSNLCDQCKLRFLCLSEKKEIVVPKDIIVKNKIIDFNSLISYMFSEETIISKTVKIT